MQKVDVSLSHKLLHQDVFQELLNAIQKGARADARDRFSLIWDVYSPEDNVLVLETSTVAALFLIRRYLDAETISDADKPRVCSILEYTLAHPLMDSNRPANSQCWTKCMLLYGILLCLLFLVGFAVKGSL